MKPWDDKCKVIGCAWKEDELGLCIDHRKKWEAELRDLTHPQHPWMVVLRFERWLIHEQRRMAFQAALQRASELSKK